MLDILQEEKVVERNRHTAAYLNRRAADLRSHPRVDQFRNTGMIWAFDVPRAGAGFGPGFQQRALKAGVLLRPLGSTVYWMPPYVISNEEIDFFMETLGRLLDDTPG